MKSRLFGRVLTTTGLIAAAGLASSAYGDTVQIVARSGDAVSIGTSNFTFSRLITSTGALSAPVIGNNGQIVFHGQLSGQVAGTQHTLVRMNTQGNKLVLARSGSTWATGQPAFSTFGAPLMNDSGQVAFPGNVTGTGVTSANDTGFWHFDGTRVSVLAREGSQAPGATGNFSGFADTAFSKAATNRWLSLRSTLSGTGVNSTNNKVLHEMSSETSLGAIATAGSAAPGTSVSFYDPQRTSNARGDVLVYSTLQGTGVTTTNNHGLWLDSGAPLAFITRSGASAPGSPSGSTFTSLFSAITKPMINSTGRAAFMATTAAATGAVNGGGIWLANGSQLEPVVVTGTAAPDVGLGSCTMSGGCEPNGQRAFHLTDDHSVLFWTMLSGPLAHSGNNVAMMVSELDANNRRVIRPIIRGGMQCPGAESGVTISNAYLGQMTRVTSNGDAYFWVQLQGESLAASTNFAMLKWSGGQLSMVIRNMSPLPGVSNILLSQPSGTAPTMYVNDRGQAVVLSGSYNSSTGSTANLALWRVDENGQVLFVAGNNAVMPTSESSPTVGTLALSPNCLNDNGEFVFMAQTLTGGGDVLVKGSIQATTQPPAPCPGDFNNDREVTQQDLFDFLSEWFLGTARGDFNRDSEVGVEDIFNFFAAWAAGGCP